MLEKIKEIPFIDESAAVHLYGLNGRLVLERSDRVIWAREFTTVAVGDNINCYVEASKFFMLLPDIQEVSMTTCLVVKLKNGAKYELPLLSVSWDTQSMPEVYEDTIMFKLDDLMLCTLKNLVTPELQCVYIDEKGAVTCNYISACVTSNVKAHNTFLLPADVQELVNNRLCSVHVDDEKIYIKAPDFELITTKPLLGEDPWWESIRSMLNAEATFVRCDKLTESLKRLMMFGDYVVFTGDTVMCGTNFEPFAFADLGVNQYEIERLSKILGTATDMSEASGNLVMKNTSSMFLLSPMEEAE